MRIRLSPVIAPWIEHVEGDRYRIVPPHARVDPIMQEAAQALGEEPSRTLHETLLRALSPSGREAP